MLKVKNLTFEVNEEGKKRCLVNHISFDVQDGEMLVITGPNGGGKSTLAKVLAGIEKANSGEIYLDDENITILIIVQMRELAMHFSSHPALKV